MRSGPCQQLPLGCFRSNLAIAAGCLTERHSSQGAVAERLDCSSSQSLRAMSAALGRERRTADTPAAAAPFLCTESADVFFLCCVCAPTLLDLGLKSACEDLHSTGTPHCVNELPFPAKCDAQVILLACSAAGEGSNSFGQHESRSCRLSALRPR